MSHSAQDSAVASSSKSSRPTIDLNSQVDPKVLHHFKLEDRVEKALLGYARMDVLERELTFGTWNSRHLNDLEKKLLLESFNINGLRRFEIQYAIPIVVPKHAVVLSSLARRANIETELPDGSHLNILEFTQDAPDAILAAGGRHRVAALKEWLQQQQDILHDEEQELETLCNLVKADDDAAAATAGYRDEISEREARVAMFKGIVDTNGEWVIGVYDEGQCTSSSSISSFSSSSQRW